MYNNIIKSTFLLGLFALFGTGLLIWIGISTEDRIQTNEHATLLKQLKEIVPADRYNNDLVANTLLVTAPNALGSKKALTIYRARLNNKPIAAILTAIAPDGYSGNIHLLIGVYADGKLAGVRAIKHKETPGLGDAVEAKRSDWILNFTGKSLTNPSIEQWKVQKDGGTFDSFTGATITPRAVVKATRKALEYFKAEQSTLFSNSNNDSKIGLKNE